MGFASCLHRRGAVYHFRVRIPSPLAAIVGRADLRFSLGTREPTLARRLSQLARLGTTRLFEDLCRQMTNAERPETDQPFEGLVSDSPEYPVVLLSYEQLRDLAREYFRNEFKRDQVHRMNRSTFKEDFTTAQQVRLDEEKKLRTALGAGNMEAMHDTARGVLRHEGITPTFDGQRPEVLNHTLNQLSFLLLRAKLAANLVAQAHDAGDFSAAPADPIFADIREVNLVKALAEVLASRPTKPEFDHLQSQTLDEALEGFLKERNLAEKSRKDYENTIRWLKEITGEKKIAEVTQADLLEFKDRLLDMPANAAQKFGTNSMKEAIARSKAGRIKFTLMTTATINNKYLSNVRAFFEWAAENGRTRDKANPAAKLSVKVRESDKGDRLPFSIRDLQKLFGAPLFAGCQSATRVHAPGKTMVRDHRFWAPLLALFAGLRLNEIGQLTVDDVHPHNGLLHLHVTTTPDQEDQDESGEGDQSSDQSSPTRGRRGKRKKIKTTNARRLVPIHEDLIKMGFLNLVQACIDRGHKRLFPEWQKSKDGYYSSRYSRFFNQQLLPPLKLKTPELVFHSLRHNFKDALRNAAIAPETQNRAIGHKTGHVGEGYGSGQLVENESLATDIPCRPVRRFRLLS